MSIFDGNSRKGSRLSSILTRSAGVSLVGADHLSFSTNPLEQNWTSSFSPFLVPITWHYLSASSANSHELPYCCPSLVPQQLTQMLGCSNNNVASSSSFLFCCWQLHPTDLVLHWRSHSKPLKKPLVAVENQRMSDHFKRKRDEMRCQLPSHHDPQPYWASFDQYPCGGASCYAQSEHVIFLVCQLHWLPVCFWVQSTGNDQRNPLHHGDRLFEGPLPCGYIYLSHQAQEKRRVTDPIY